MAKQKTNTKMSEAEMEMMEASKTGKTQAEIDAESYEKNARGAEEQRNAFYNDYQAWEKQSEKDIDDIEQGCKEILETTQQLEDQTVQQYGENSKEAEAFRDGVTEQNEKTVEEILEELERTKRELHASREAIDKLKDEKIAFLEQQLANQKDMTLGTAIKNSVNQGIQNCKNILNKTKQNLKEFTQNRHKDFLLAIDKYKMKQIDNRIEFQRNQLKSREKIHTFVQNRMDSIEDKQQTRAVAAEAVKNMFRKKEKRVNLETVTGNPYESMFYQKLNWAGSNLEDEIYNINDKIEGLQSERSRLEAHKDMSLDEILAEKRAQAAQKNKTHEQAQEKTKEQER